jgi:hypothetical protein
MRRREFTSLLSAAAAAWPIFASAQRVTPLGLQAAPASGAALAETRYLTIDIGGLDIFYREAGPAAGPVVLLLHGFPTARAINSSRGTIATERMIKRASSGPPFLSIGENVLSLRLSSGWIS